MKASVNRIYGNPSVLNIEDIPKPIVSNKDILIKVHSSGVNRTDSGFLHARPFVTRFFSGLINPRNLVLGCEFAGEVVELGADVSNFKLGDKVFGFDDNRWGGHAEFKVIDASKSVALIPKGVSYESAGVAGEGAHYALSYIMTMRKLGVKRVLVHGATGAIGSSAVQLMKHEGWYVVATSTTKQMSTIKGFGADKVIDWQKVDFTQCGERFDVVFDAVGKSTFKACKKLLRQKGVYIATELGPHAQNVWFGLFSPLFELFGAKRILFPLPINNQAIIQELADRLADKSFTPLIDRTYPLDAIKEAYEYVETGQKVGNVAIKIN